MNALLKQDWINALRSGNYTKGNFWLRKGDCYCALGVLCDITGLKQFPQKHGVVAYGNEFAVRFLPSDCLPLWEMEAMEAVEVFKLNDDLNKSFIEIADWIKENL